MSAGTRETVKQAKQWLPLALIIPLCITAYMVSIRIMEGQPWEVVMAYVVVMNVVISFCALFEVERRSSDLGYEHWFKMDVMGMKQG